MQRLFTLVNHVFFEQLSSAMEIIQLGELFACTTGLAVFRDVKGAVGEHAHWTHQIAIDLDGGEVACFCEGQWIRGQGVFVPRHHTHSVGAGRQLNLFFDPSIDWLDEVFGGSLDCDCAQVLDRDTLQGILSCFYSGASLLEGMSIFTKAFELRGTTDIDAESAAKWQILMSKATQATADTPAEELPAAYTTLGRLLASEVHP